MFQSDQTVHERRRRAELGKSTAATLFTRVLFVAARAHHVSLTERYFCVVSWLSLHGERFFRPKYIYIRKSERSTTPTAAVLICSLLFLLKREKSLFFLLSLSVNLTVNSGNKKVKRKKGLNLVDPKAWKMKCHIYSLTYTSLAENRKMQHVAVTWSVLPVVELLLLG
jgi:hypothetical protein